MLLIAACYLMCLHTFTWLAHNSHLCLNCVYSTCHVQMDFEENSTENDWIEFSDPFEIQKHMYTAYEHTHARTQWHTGTVQWTHNKINQIVWRVIQCRIVDGCGLATTCMLCQFYWINEANQGKSINFFSNALYRLKSHRCWSNISISPSPFPFSFSVTFVFIFISISIQTNWESSFCSDYYHKPSQVKPCECRLLFWITNVYAITARRHSIEINSIIINPKWTIHLLWSQHSFAHPLMLMPNEWWRTQMWVRGFVYLPK